MNIGPCPGCGLTHNNPREDCGGWRPPRCARCGHVEGDHSTTSTGILNPVQVGGCYVCDCPRYVPEVEAVAA